MEYTQFGSKVLLRLDKGDEIVSTIKAFCRENKIRLASVSGIGAVSRADIGIFIQDTKVYKTKALTGSMEITSLAGNVTEMNNEVYLHLHVTLTDDTYRASGGHLNNAWVGATCEIIIDIINGHVNREKSEEVGLNVIQFI